MKNTIYILIFLLLVFLTNCQKSPRSDIENFNEFLGKEKATALNEAIKSFDKFLETNFPNQDNHSDRTKQFLKQFSNSDSPGSTWIFTTKRNKKILEQLESSGLRKEIWIYGKENYAGKYNIYDLINPFKNDSSQSLGELEIIEDEIIPIPRPATDSTMLAQIEKELDEQYNNLLLTNEKGEFLYGLAKFANNDSIVHEYVEVKLIAGDISPSLVASAFLSQIKDFENPFIKRMIFVELYYWMMKWNIEKNENKKNNDTPIKYILQGGFGGTPTADSRIAVPCPSDRNALRNPPRQHVPTVGNNAKSFTIMIIYLYFCNFAKCVKKN